MAYLLSPESISEGYPDKAADQISDTSLDQFLAYDSSVHCATETFVTIGQVVAMGEVCSKEYAGLQTIARKIIKEVGYVKSECQFSGDSCSIMSAIYKQSEDIGRGVNRANEDE